ncbi:GNAT family N-acetyltransferase [Streptomyces lydicus]|uniref:GNAT family N-acetyltransferase n=1 Tax=Streptomyces lydicus TaxID=47763 RepID=UPI0034033B5D
MSGAPADQTSASVADAHAARANAPVDAWVRAPRAGDEEAIATLVLAAVGATVDVIDASQFATTVCTSDGATRIPHGTGRVLVAGLSGATEPVSMLYVTPPVRLVEEFDTRGPSTQKLLAREVREIELMATAPTAQCNGVGSALLHAAHALVTKEGVRVMLAKVSASDFPVLRWWRHRGYTLAQPGQSVRLHLPQSVTCNDGYNGYRLAVCPLVGTVSERRGLLHVRPKEMDSAR